MLRPDSDTDLLSSNHIDTRVGEAMVPDDA